MPEVFVGELRTTLVNDDIFKELCHSALMLDCFLR